MAAELGPSVVIEVEANRPPVHCRAVIFYCYGSYLPYAALLASRLAALHPNRRSDICVCTGAAEVDLSASLAAAGIRICRIRIGELFDGLRLDQGASPDVYLRLALPTAFGADYDRILYMDADIFVQGGDFDALLDMDLGSLPCDAVHDDSQTRTPRRPPQQFRELGLLTAPYFTAGVLLMNVRAHEAVDILGQCFRLGWREVSRLIRHDQNLHNALLQGRWAELSPVWNWQYTWASRLYEAMQGALVVHFIGSREPWKDTVGELPPLFARTMAEFIAAHWPGRPLAPVGAGPVHDPVLMRRLLWKHWVGASVTALYLRRFPTDLTVHVPAGAEP